MSDTAIQPDQGASDEHGGHGNMVGTYVSIFLILTMLTGLEGFIPQVYSSPWDATLKMLLLCMLAFGKAVLVAVYFMHLKWETKWTRWIAATPIYMGLLVIVIMLETAYR